MRRFALKRVSSRKAFEITHNYTHQSFIGIIIWIKKNIGYLRVKLQSVF